MQRDLPAALLPHTGPASLSAGPGQAGPGVIATLRGWRPQDRLEHQVLDALRLLGPLTSGAGLVAYAAFPWSALLDSLADPGRLEAAYLRAALQMLELQRPKGAALVTSCSHPRALEHLALFRRAGVTDLFCPDAGAAEGGRLCDGILLHPLAALPAPDSPAPAGEGPGGAFLFCPPEAGGNTPRLWSAVAAGLIPVLPAGAEPTLPGPGALWRAALLQPAEATRDTVLAALAADPARLRAARAALAGLALLHRPESLGIAVLEVLQARAANWTANWAAPPGDTAPLPSPAQSRLARLGAPFTADPARQPGPLEAEALHAAAGRDLLQGHPAALDRLQGAELTAARQLLARAEARLPPDSPAAQRLARLLAQSQHSAEPPAPRPLAAPARASRSGPLRVYLLGPRGQRTPLAYAPMQPVLAGRISLVDHPDEAELIVTGWSRDFEEQAELLDALWARGRRPRLVVLSEEPLWDSLWSGGLAARERSLDCQGRRLSYRVLSHVTSEIFAFEHLPWFVLSETQYASRQAQLIAGFAALTPRALLRHWQAAPLQAAFVAERRSGPDYAAAFPAEEVWGLSRYRSRIAELTPGPAVLRLGQGWPDPDLAAQDPEAAPPRRQSLPDWHLDKLARLHGRLRVMAAYENTLQRDYITEKPFDAFALGAVAAVAAPAGHRLLDLVPAEALLNTQAAPPELAAARIASFRPDLALAEAWREAAHSLVARLTDLPALQRERRRLAGAMLAELTLALDQPQGAPPLDSARPTAPH